MKPWAPVPRGQGPSFFLGTGLRLAFLGADDSRNPKENPKNAPVSDRHAPSGLFFASTDHMPLVGPVTEGIKTP